MPMIDLPLKTIGQDELLVRDIVGRSYAREYGNPNDRYSAARSLNITGIPSQYEFAGHAAFSIRGSPPRGLVILDLTYDPVALDVIARRHIDRRDARILRNFIVSVSGVPYDQIPCFFRWTSRDDLREFSNTEHLLATPTT
jgi:hypothetical protein